MKLRLVQEEAIDLDDLLESGQLEEDDPGRFVVEATTQRAGEVRE